MSDKKADIITAYEANSFIEAFDFDGLPGKDADMKTPAEHTKLERWSREGKPYLEEYAGSGKFKDRAVIVTGGDSGIGRSVAVFFAREGADITIAYLEAEQEDAEKTKKLIEQAGRKCILVPGDLRSQEKREQLVRKHLDAFKYIDVLVNNASQQIQCKDLTEIDMQNVEDTFQTNIVQMIGICRAALPHMQRGSSIINTTSVTAMKGSGGMVDYSSTKGAISAFTRSLALQIAPKGIRVNAVAPGPVLTPLQPASRSADQMEGWGVGDLPLHGRVAQPAEIAPAYIYLALANTTTGSTIHTNSGQWYNP